MMDFGHVMLALTGDRNSPTGGRWTPAVGPEREKPVSFDLDIGLALDLLTQAVHSRGGDHVDEPVRLNGDEYLPCVYAHDGATRCIVGEVLLNAGVSIRALEEMGDEGIRDLYMSRRLPMTMTLGALLVLQRAQLAQDQGCSWGDSLQQAARAAADLVGIVPVPVVDRATHGYSL